MNRQQMIESARDKIILPLVMVEVLAIIIFFSCPILLIWVNPWIIVRVIISAFLAVFILHFLIIFLGKVIEEMVDEEIAKR